MTEGTEVGIDVVGSFFSSGMCGGPMTLTGVACLGIGYAVTYGAMDAFDIQSGDYHYQIGPVYFNFQGDFSNPYNPVWTLEKTRIRH